MAERLAIVGTGISGLACAYFLDSRFDITLLEKNDYLGGHTNTVTVEGERGPLAMDTGFMVFNRVTYPNLLRFFETLGVYYYPTEMSFSVHYGPTGLEWNGAGLNKIFGQRKNLFNLRFWRMLQNLDRFNREAESGMASEHYRRMTIEEYAAARGYGEDFLTLFLVPMSAAIWSTAPERMRRFPIHTLLHFFHNHGFLGLDTHHQWYTVGGGAKTYIDTLMKRLSSHVLLNAPVQLIRRVPEGVLVVLANGNSDVFDRVILASHADQSLAMLESPTALEAELLTPFQYEQNIATIHSDRSVMPKSKRCWGSWNYRVDGSPLTGLTASTHYWMNRLQRLDTDTDYFVSINAPSTLAENRVVKTIPYEHPGFTLSAVDAQIRLGELNRQHPDQRVYFCGSYFKYGFHEDAFTSALELCRTLTGDPIWQ